MSRVNKTDSVLVLLKVKKPANLAETRNKKGKTLGNLLSVFSVVLFNWIFRYCSQIMSETVTAVIYL